MKRLLLVTCFLYLFTLILSPSAFADTKNSLRNGGFEEDGGMWQSKTRFESTTIGERIALALGFITTTIDVEIERNQDFVYSGEKSLHISASKSLGITQAASIDPDKHFFAHANVLVKKGTVKLVVKDSQNGQEFVDVSDPQQTSWQRLAVNLPPQTISSTVTFSILAENDSKWYIDNVILHEVDFTPRPAAVTFQDFHDSQFFWKGKPVEQKLPDQKVEAQTIAAEITPLPPHPRTYQTKVLIAVQVDTEFATPENIIEKVNERLTSFSINKRLEGTVEVFDQTIETNCTVSYYGEPNHVPDEFCTQYPLDQSILMAIVHGGYDGFALWPGKIFTTDLAGSNRQERDFVLLHELGHVLGFDKHYNDTWSAYDSGNTDVFYSSPFIRDIMGLGDEPLHFFDHAREVFNRSPYLDGFGSSIITSNLPNRISVVDQNNEPFFGQLTIFPGLDQGYHRFRKIDPAVFLGPISVFGTLDYQTLGKPLIAWVKAENSHGTTFTWLDSSLLQLAFWRGEKAVLSIPLESDPPQSSPSPTSTPTLTPTPCPRQTEDLDGDCDVDITDILIWRQFWAQGNDEADVNGDGQKNILDYLSVFREWLK